MDDMTEEQKRIIDELFVEVSDKLFQFVYRFTGDTVLAEDVVQQTYTLACLKADALEEHTNPRGWLLVTAKYLMQREIAGSQYRLRADIEDFEAKLSAESGKDSIAEHLPRGLGEEERVFLLEHLEYGYTLKEMAERRGITPDACRRRYAKIKKKCRELMLQEREELEKI